MRLTKSELCVLELIVQGLSNEEIAQKLFISKHTVKAHVGSIIKKLDAKNRSNAIYIAIKENLV